MGDKAHNQKGNSPDYWLRSKNNTFSGKDSITVKIIIRWAWKQPLFLKCVTAY